MGKKNRNKQLSAKEIIDRINQRTIDKFGPAYELNLKEPPEKFWQIFFAILSDCLNWSDLNDQIKEIYPLAKDLINSFNKNHLVFKYLLDKKLELANIKSDPNCLELDIIRYDSDRIAFKSIPQIGDLYRCISKHLPGVRDFIEKCHSEKTQLGDNKGIIVLSCVLRLIKDNSLKALAETFSVLFNEDIDSDEKVSKSRLLSFIQNTESEADKLLAPYLEKYLKKVHGFKLDNSDQSFSNELIAELNKIDVDLVGFLGNPISFWVKFFQKAMNQIDHEEPSTAVYMSLIRAFQELCKNPKGIFDSLKAGLLENSELRILVSRIVDEHHKQNKSNDGGFRVKKLLFAQIYKRIAEAYSKALIKSTDFKNLDEVEKAFDQLEKLENDTEEFAKNYLEAQDLKADSLLSIHNYLQSITRQSKFHNFLRKHLETILSQEQKELEEHLNKIVKHFLNSDIEAADQLIFKSDFIAEFGDFFEVAKAINQELINNFTPKLEVLEVLSRIPNIKTIVEKLKKKSKAIEYVFDDFIKNKEEDFNLLENEVRATLLYNMIVRENLSIANEFVDYMNSIITILEFHTINPYDKKAVNSFIENYKPPKALDFGEEHEELEHPFSDYFELLCGTINPYEFLLDQQDEDFLRSFLNKVEEYDKNQEIKPDLKQHQAEAIAVKLAEEAALAEEAKKAALKKDRKQPTAQPRKHSKPPIVLATIQEESTAQEDCGAEEAETTSMSTDQCINAFVLIYSSPEHRNDFRELVELNYERDDFDEVIKESAIIMVSENSKSINTYVSDLTGNKLTEGKVNVLVNELVNHFSTTKDIKSFEVSLEVFVANYNRADKQEIIRDLAVQFIDKNKTDFLNVLQKGTKGTTTGAYIIEFIEKYRESFLPDPNKRRGAPGSGQEPQSHIALKEEAKQLKEKLAAEEEKNKRLEVENEQLRKESTVEKKKNKCLTERVEGLEKQLKDKNITIQALKNTLSELQKLGATDQVKLLKDHIEALVGENYLLKAECNSLREKLKKALSTDNQTSIRRNSF